ncbi:MAG: hypothetical protein AB1512_31945 [Thermodesulfobacteriota bacterium]
MIKLLVASEDPVLRMLYSDELVEEGYDVVLSADLADLSRRIQSEKPDLVLVDFPRRRGGASDLTGLLRNGLCPARLVLYTDEAPSDRDRKAADYVVVRSSRLDNLKRAVRDALEGEGPGGTKPSLAEAALEIKPPEQLGFEHFLNAYDFHRP